MRDVTGNPPALTAMIVLAALIVLASIVTPIYTLLGLMPGAGHAKAAWSVTVRQVVRPAAVALPASTTPELKGLVVQPLQIEDRHEALERAWMLHVEVRNTTRSVQTLRWDVSRAPLLRMPDGRTLRPIGHKLHGLTEPSLAVKGIMEVEAPPKGVYSLYPVFSAESIPRGARLVLEGVGSARVSR